MCACVRTHVRVLVVSVYVHMCVCGGGGEVRKPCLTSVPWTLRLETPNLHPAPYTPNLRRSWKQTNCSYSQSCSTGELSLLHSLSPPLTPPPLRVPNTHASCVVCTRWVCHVHTTFLAHAGSLSRTHTHTHTYTRTHTHTHTQAFTYGAYGQAAPYGAPYSYQADAWCGGSKPYILNPKHYAPTPAVITPIPRTGGVEHQPPEYSSLNTEPKP